MPRRQRSLSWVVLVIAVCWQRQVSALDPVHPAAPAPAPQPLYRKVKLSIGYHFSSGDYGSTDTTNIMYVPLVLNADISRWNFQLTIPYLRITGPAGVIEGPAGPVQTNGNGDGLGDIVTRVSYLLPWWEAFPDWMPFIGLAGLVKFPTASRSDGLGTGAFDFGIEGEVTWALQPFTPFATLGYRFLGNLPDTPLRNVFGISVGGVYRVLDTLSAGMTLDYRQASSGSTGERLELVPFASWKFIPPWSIEVYTSAGLASGSPNVGVGLQLGYTWD